jgi:NOL1/NOP2/fmu family ribosome biogenesis protein
VAWIAKELGADVLSVPMEDSWGITGNLTGKDFPVYRFLPHKTKGEGFFLAALRKHEGEVETVTLRTEKKKKGKDTKQKTLTVPKEAKEWLEDSSEYALAMKDTSVVAFPKAYESEYALLQQSLKVIHAGITLGEIKGKDLIPHHSLAMSTALASDAFPKAEVTYEQAISYLRKEGLILDADVSRGYVLLTYQGVPLGFVKNIGNRANNLYPQEWRIRSGYLPEEVVTVF